jgi:hypothetical protein
MGSYPLSVLEGVSDLEVCANGVACSGKNRPLVAVSLGFYPTRGSQRVQNLYCLTQRYVNYIECSLSLSPSFPCSHSLALAARPALAMSDTTAEKQLLLDQLHRQFKHAISYNLYTGIAYGAPH